MVVVFSMKLMGGILVGFAAIAAAGPARSADAAPYCQGEYAEDLSALSAQAREVDSYAGSYAYAVRTTATYECLSYGSDGNLKKARAFTTAYGTAFGLRRDGADTLLMTNTHVAEWPAVTDDEHPVEGVPQGCKRIADSLNIVDDDHDEYAADDVPLTRIVSDPAMDVAVLRAHAKLRVMPWKIGKSAGLAARDVVEVKGFPLGEFRATNVGKVVSAYDRDVQGEWNHDDFVIDALLSTGGSGSPVLAISCKTGEFELVGVFHAHYNSAGALNVVVAIDQLRPLMTTLKRTPRPANDQELDAAARTRLLDAIAHDADPPFFSVGPLVASVHVRPDGALVFAAFAADFPRNARPLIAIEDLPGDDKKQFGKTGTIYVAGPRGLVEYTTGNADAEMQTSFARTLAVLRKDALAAFDYRAATKTVATTRDAYNKLAADQRALGRMLASQRDLAAGFADLATRAAAKSTGVVTTLEVIEQGPPPVATTP
jgi:Trypsin-like peptidase domain